MSNSSLVTYTNITNDRNSPRNHKIDTITIHCVVGGKTTAKQTVDYFKTSSRQVSSNYVVGYDGSIGLSVPESDRAWTSSSPSNDHRAITIETASDLKSPYTVTDKAYNALINLVADICKRNGIPKLIWSNNKDDRINHRNGCNMTVHRDFASTDCPGKYLYDRMPDIAAKVNAKLNNNIPVVKPNTNVTTDFNAGDKIILKNVPIYISSTATTKAGDRSGTYYLWSNEVINNKMKITDTKTNVGKANKVVGWLAYDDVKKYIDKPIVYVPQSIGGNDMTRGYFKNGDKNEGVYALKQMLMALKKKGIITQGVDDNNVFGAGTEIAVKQVQKKAGLEQDGFAGPQTLHACYVFLTK